MSLVAAFFIGTQFNMQKVHKIWTFNFLQVVWQHIFSVVLHIVLADFPAVKEFVKIG